MKIAIAGAGYVGLSLATLLSRKHDVILVDIDQDKIDKINNRISPINDDLITDFLSNESLKLLATNDINIAYTDADYLIIATPTNYDEVTNSFNTQSVINVIDSFLTLNNNGFIVIKSTIPVGFTEELLKIYGYEKIFFSPEFLRETKALYDNLYPSRIVVGCKESLRVEAERFADLLCDCALKENVAKVIINPSEAEAIKLFSNTYLALRIAFFNELDTYCESNGLKSLDIIKGVCLDERIGDYYNNPSFGYGGYCLPKDTKQLLSNYKNIPENIINAVVESNSTRINYISNKIYNFALQKCKSGNAVIGIYRLTMKTNSDNFRQSSVKGVMNELKKMNCKIVIYEPLLNEPLFDGFEVVKDLHVFLTKSDVIVANRYDKCLDIAKNKVYTRDIFGKD